MQAMDITKNSELGERRKWLPTIDGLRAIAITAVLFSHTVALSGHAASWALGNAGVSLFFAISGFLAYYVLHRDEKRFGRIDYNYFLFRRVLRIWPAYFLVIFLAFLLASKDAVTNATFLPLFTFTLNFDMASFTGWPLPTISPLWSIAVEEQFYVLAPLMYRLLRSRYMLVFCFSVFALSNIGRLLYAHYAYSQTGNGGLYYLTYTHADIFLAGGIIAHWFLGGGKVNKWVQWLAFIVSLLLLDKAMQMWRPVLFPPYSENTIIPYMILPFAFAMLLMSVLPMGKTTAFSWLLSTKPFMVVAKLSYSLYLLHLLVASHVTNGYIALYSALFASAILLHFFVERPFLKIKNNPKKFTGKFPWPALSIWALLTVGVIRYFFIS